MSAQDKINLRKTIRETLASLSPEEFSAAGREAAELLPDIPRWDIFRSVLAFTSLSGGQGKAGEIDTEPLIKAALEVGKRVFVPHIEEKSAEIFFYRIKSAAGPWKTGSFGIREPAADPALALGIEDFPALILSPGLGFDRQGRRLGRGGGYYDRFFTVLDSGTLPGAVEENPADLFFTSCGLCMDCQILPEIPTEEHDRPMDLVLTEKRLILSVEVPS